MNKLNLDSEIDKQIAYLVKKQLDAGKVLWIYLDAKKCNYDLRRGFSKKSVKDLLFTSKFMVLITENDDFIVFSWHSIVNWEVKPKEN
jgi:hypothetical protein